MITILKMSCFILLLTKNVYCFIPKNNILRTSINQYSNIKITNLYGKRKNDDTSSDTNKISYIPKSENQATYVNSLNDKNIDLLFCLGPAGTGKTLFACNYAISRLHNNSVKKIIITRPMITIEENMGYLPGDINDKMQPFMNPIYDIFLERFTQKEIESLRYNNVLEVVPLGFIQGRTFKNSIIIADEMQNSTPNQMFMLLTRIGENSKMILTGDPQQTVNENNGLIDVVTKLNKNYDNDEDMYNDGMKIIEMEAIDIQRHRLVAKINYLYKK